MTNEHTHEAWVAGTHELPDDAPMTPQDGDVLVYDIDAERWYVVTAAEFDKRYEWV